MIVGRSQNAISPDGIVRPLHSLFLVHSLSLLSLRSLLSLLTFSRFYSLTLRDSHSLKRSDYTRLSMRKRVLRLFLTVFLIWKVLDGCPIIGPARRLRLLCFLLRRKYMCSLCIIQCCQPHMFFHTYFLAHTHTHSVTHTHTHTLHHAHTHTHTYIVYSLSLKHTHTHTLTHTHTNTH